PGASASSDAQTLTRPPRPRSTSPMRPPQRDQQESCWGCRGLRDARPGGADEVRRGVAWRFWSLGSDLPKPISVDPDAHSIRVRRGSNPFLDDSWGPHLQARPITTWEFSREWCHRPPCCRRGKEEDSACPPANDDLRNRLPVVPDPLSFLV